MVFQYCDATEAITFSVNFHKGEKKNDCQKAVPKNSPQCNQFSEQLYQVSRSTNIRWLSFFFLVPVRKSSVLSVKSQNMYEIKSQHNIITSNAQRRMSELRTTKNDLKNRHNRLNTDIMNGTMRL